MDVTGSVGERRSGASVATTGSTLGATTETGVAPAAPPRAATARLWSVPAPAKPPVAALTTRETEVLALVRERLTNAEIADRLFVSVRTVETHVSALLRKLGASDRRALARGAAPDSADRRPSRRAADSAHDVRRTDGRSAPSWWPRCATTAW